MDFYQKHLMGMQGNPTIDVQKKQVQSILQFLTKTNSKPIEILDLGCGNGEVSLKLFVENDDFNKMNFSITGVDISPMAVNAFAKSTGHNSLLSSISALPFHDSKFDIIVFDDVLEHLEDTDSCMKEIHRMLNRDGYLLISTPNLAAWFNRLLLMFGVQPLFTEVSFLRIFGRPGNDVVGHLRVFTTRALREFLAFHNFKITSHRMSTFQSVPQTLKLLDKIFSLSTSLGANNVLLCQKIDPASNTQR